MTGSAVFVGVLRRELRLLLLTSVGWWVLGLWSFLVSVLFWLELQSFEVMQQRALLLNDPEVLRLLDFNELLLGSLFSHVQLVLLFVVPILTMRMFAEEKQRGTIDLFLLSPAPPGVWALAKIAAGFVVVSGLVAWLLVYAVVLSWAGGGAPGAAGGSVDWAQVATGLLGTSLTGCLAVVVGAGASAVVDTPVAAAVGAFVVLLLGWFLSDIAARLSGGVAGLLRSISPQAHIESFARGVLQAGDLSYFATTLTGGCLVVALLMSGGRR